MLEDDDEHAMGIDGGMFQLELGDGPAEMDDSDDELNEDFVDAQSLIQSATMRGEEVQSVNVMDAMESKLDNGQGRGDKKASPSHFDIIKVIGQGGYGKVFLVKKNCGVDKGKICAMKVLKKATIITSQKDVSHTRAERNILSAVKHPFIVDLLYAFQTKGKLYLIMNYVGGGELFTYLDREGMFMEEAGRFYAAELIIAVQHLHGLGIIYRDLKPENIMLDNDGHIVLTDFGLCKESIQPGKRTHTFCGTIEYMAPEILNREGHGTEADWWSLGALLYDMVTGSPPFVAHNRKKTMEKITKANPRFPPFLTNEIKDLLRKLLCRNLDKRLGSQAAGGPDKIKSHLWFRFVDWQKAENRGLIPPYKPRIKGDLDVSNFDRRFTEQPAADSPVPSLPHGNSGANLFEGFSYVTPSVLVESGTPGTMQFSPARRRANSGAGQQDRSPLHVQPTTKLKVESSPDGEEYVSASDSPAQAVDHPDFVVLVEDEEVSRSASGKTKPIEVKQGKSKGKRW